MRFETAKRLAFAGVAVLVLMGADKDDFDVKTQIGPHPVLPEPQQFLVPPMHLADVVGWKPGETPKLRTVCASRRWPRGWNIPVLSIRCQTGTCWWWNSSAQRLTP